MSLDPLVDPLRLQTDRSPSADARVTQLATLARGVDRVAAQTRVVRGVSDRQPGFHNPSPAQEFPRNLTDVVVVWVPRISAPIVSTGAQLSVRE
jgi:hypothetical protein